MTEEERRVAAETVATWLGETCGEDVADAWWWAHTPMPFGLPSDEHLEEGLRWAALGRERALPAMRLARLAVDERMTAALNAARGRSGVHAP